MEKNELMYKRYHCIAKGVQGGLGIAVVRREKAGWYYSFWRCFPTHDRQHRNIISFDLVQLAHKVLSLEPAENNLNVVGNPRDQSTIIARIKIRQASSIAH